ncbi:outer membrane beta-barrel protein [Ohtaekwangia koreensis]|uniref:Outer membrane protein beta-barrel domain-containing protein n=1 Tax=Ohtaekwangia koreensis TaxID=688867 RepID=A0A1T5MMB6_9BACT|nr:outer membrane beta-barrel protein [Ohtaekwangia koreensis]SKC89365.1 Outer membrane protein beta-barrel domain-containing protein [Ohtaekwangia koreensis]
MKKDIRFLVVISFLLLSFSQFSVSAQVRKGDFLLSPNLGLGYYYAGSGLAVTLGVNGEYAFTDEISGGGYIAYTRWTTDYGYQGNNYDYSYNFIDFGARASYHFAKLLRVSNKKFDPYAGAFLGFVTSSYSHDGNGVVGYDDNYGSDLRPGIFAGARYFFQPNIGVFGEVSIGLTPISGGVTFKF